MNTIALPAPDVQEAQDSDNDRLMDWLNPDSAKPNGPVSVFYLSMALYDTVTIVLNCRASDRTPVHFTTQRQVGSFGRLTVPIAHTEIAKFLDGELDVFYRVQPYTNLHAL